MESIEKNNFEEQFEPVEQNVSTEEEKGSGKGKLPENQLTTIPAVSFQKAIVDSAFTRTPTITKSLQIHCDYTSEKDESQEHEVIIKEQDNSDLTDQQANLSKDDFALKETINCDDENSTRWEQGSLQEEEMLVVVVEECSTNEEQLKLQIEEETISAASTPNPYGKDISYFEYNDDKFKTILT